MGVMYIAINRGFTLIELLVTVSVASILLAVAAPSYRTFVQDNQLTAQSNNFFSAMMLAKSEAVKRSSPATICPSTDGTTCAIGAALGAAPAVPATPTTPAVPAVAANWTNGWLVFADANGDGIVNVLAGDTIIRVGTALPGQSTLTSRSRTRVTFAASGTTLGFNDTFSLCDDRGSAQSRSLVLSLQGSLSTAKGVANTCP